MDPSSVFERAQIIDDPGELVPGRSDDERYVAIDPETSCHGVGPFEEAARTNLVYAVEAFLDEEESTVPFMSSGPNQTFRMNWLDENPTLADKILDRLP